ncbi:MAG: hypothetical protein MK142_05970 [Pseudomonadales bacterium]|nr:hypothetical protein [Pseudomonadales bacterium]
MKNENLARSQAAIGTILASAMERHASDVHILASVTVRYCICGKLRTLEKAVPSVGDTAVSRMALHGNS